MNINTAKQSRARKRILNSRVRKAKGRARFLISLAKRRGELLDKAPCQEGHLQLVSEVMKLGNCVVYKASACSGCPAGAEYISGCQKPKRKKFIGIKQPNELKGCELVRDRFLLAPLGAEDPKPGDILTAMRPGLSFSSDVVV